MRALVVEDEPLIRMHLCDLLEEAGFECEEAGNAAQAIALLEDGWLPEILVTDFNLGPGPDGADLAAEALRRLPEDLDWTASIYADHPGEVQIRVAKAIRDRIKVIGPEQASLAELLSHSDVFVAASNGPSPDQAAVRQAIASGAVPVTTTMSRYVELVGDGQRGLLFPAGDPVTLAGQILRGTFNTAPSAQ